MKEVEIKMESKKIEAEEKVLVYPLNPDISEEDIPEYLNPKDFYSHHMVSYPKEVPCTGWTSIRVLEFLNGKKWDEVALAYVHALRPSSIRVTTGCCTCDARTWRVTVTVDEDDIIEYIEQEVEVALPERVDSGWMLREVLEYGIDSDVAEWHRLKPDHNMICGGIMGTYKMVNGEAVHHPLSKPDDEVIQRMLEACEDVK